MKKLILFLFCFSILLSCKKKEEPTINPCANGVKDNGEEDVDCGGTCQFCYHYPYLIFKYRGDAKQPDIKSIEYINGEYILKAEFDTVKFQLNFGSNGNPGTYSIKPVNSGASCGQLPYFFYYGVVGIGENNTTEKYMSGNFEAYFFRDFDTIKLEGGQFEYLAY